MKIVLMMTNLQLDLLPRCVLEADLLRAGNQEQALQTLTRPLNTFQNRNAPFFCEFVTSLGAHCSARASVLYTSIGWHLIFLPVIGGGYLVHLGAHTQQVRNGLTVYTSLCTQPSSSLCDWLTRFTYIYCP